MPGSEDLAVYFAEDAVPVVFGDAAPVDGLFSIADAEFAGPPASVYGTESYVIVQTAQVPSGTKQGDALTVNADAYVIRHLAPEPPDGQLTRVWLGRP